MQLFMTKEQLLLMLTVVKAKPVFPLHTGHDGGFVGE